MNVTSKIYTAFQSSLSLSDTCLHIEDDGIVKKISNNASMNAHIAGSPENTLYKVYRKPARNWLTEKLIINLAHDCDLPVAPLVLGDFDTDRNAYYSYSLPLYQNNASIIAMLKSMALRNDTNLPNDFAEYIRSINREQGLDQLHPDQIWRYLTQDKINKTYQKVISLILELQRPHYTQIATIIPFLMMTQARDFNVGNMIFDYSNQKNAPYFIDFEQFNQPSAIAEMPTNNDFPSITEHQRIALAISFMHSDKIPSAMHKNIISASQALRTQLTDEKIDAQTDRLIDFTRRATSVRAEERENSQIWLKNYAIRIKSRRDSLANFYQSVLTV